MLHRSVCRSELLSINVNTGHSSWCQPVTFFEVNSQSYGLLRAHILILQIFYVIGFSLFCLETLLSIGVLQVCNKAIFLTINIFLPTSAPLLPCILLFRYLCTILINTVGPLFHSILSHCIYLLRSVLIVIHL
jgi:hypothetical protein